MNMLNVILLSGKKNEVQRSDGEYPEYLSECDGKPLIQSLIENCAALSPRKIICMFSSSDTTKLHLRNMVHQMHPAASVLPIQDITKGAACTALLASEQIDNDEELLILSTTEVLDVSLADVVHTFRENGDDAGVVIFKSLHPRYSFVRLATDNLVVEAAEKNPISPHAIAGVYWFKSGSMFVSAVKDMIRKDAKVNNSFFISPSLNELVLQHKRIGTYRIEPTQYRPLKTHSQLQAFETGTNR
ncbi:glycosyl transferase family 2 [Pseudomonas sp. HLS-6]|uniref:glycosyltransferase family 2 protein n=1 Tax=Pseudomonas sp. HLS-6 TaxID=2049589 RepID=UPI000C1847F1|nr:glycosyltransferase family 2 protein [Pseudomonas sp. HLS-6]ATR84280.1 glycosyl transferase family 2 [Pseudomonas sp. HLS-6]